MLVAAITGHPADLELQKWAAWAMGSIGQQEAGVEVRQHAAEAW